LVAAIAKHTVGKMDKYRSHQHGKGQPGAPEPVSSPITGMPRPRSRSNQESTDRVPESQAGDEPRPSKVRSPIQPNLGAPWPIKTSPVTIRKAVIPQPASVCIRFLRFMGSLSGRCKVNSRVQMVLHCIRLMHPGNAAISRQSGANANKWNYFFVTGF
jgi:hypothetical protein